MNVEMEAVENGSVSKPKGPPQEDFPWPHFVSLAMHNLMNQWKIQPVESTVIKPQPKVNNHLFTITIYFKLLTVIVTN